MFLSVHFKSVFVQIETDYCFLINSNIVSAEYVQCPVYLIGYICVYFNFYLENIVIENFKQSCVVVFI